ncbi:MULTISPECIES: stage III sporulation protein AG [Clostridium]|uniref:stage III sporulation protein AG n=1 Tax=Clostridium TaxID=1485 RepID=UPI000509C4D8|nr:stage III sporulation protein AG [Clostridium amazonitimonense]
MNLKKIVDELSKKGTKGTLFNILIIFLIGLFIVIISDVFKNTSTKKTVTNEQENKEIAIKDSILSYEQEQKSQLKYILTKIEGVGSVEVMMYFESGEEHVPALDMNNSTSTTQEKDTVGGSREIIQKNDGTKVVMSNKGNENEPLILKTYKPKVTGIIIVAEGAEDKKVQYNITKAVSSFYNIPDNKVNVYSMKK